MEKKMNIKSASALLVMDMQSFILSNLEDSEPIIKNVKSCIEKARSENIPVIYAVLEFRDGMPEISPSNHFFSKLKERLNDDSLKHMSDIPEAIAPQPGEVIVKKKRISAFSGSDLEMILKASGIEHLFLTGIATSGVVLSTFTEALDKDYKITVIGNACKDRNEELHKMLINNYFLGKAEVRTCENWQISRV